MKVNFETFISQLSQKLSYSLPGERAHKKLEPASRKGFPANPDLSLAKQSSVLALFYHEAGNTRLVFIQRPVYNGVHSGQIAFPGGAYEPSDENSRNTALRETFEEIGVPEDQIRVIGKLSPLYIPPSNFLVHPFVGYTERVPIFKPDSVEVQEVFSLKIDELCAPENLQIRPIKGAQFELNVPCFYVDNRLIWGATSMMLNELIEVIERN